MVDFAAHKTAPEAVCAAEIVTRDDPVIDPFDGWFVM
jgi:hypothetical protein